MGHRGQHLISQLLIQVPGQLDWWPPCLGTCCHVPWLWLWSTVMWRRLPSTQLGLVPDYCPCDLVLKWHHVRFFRFHITVKRVLGHVLTMHVFQGCQCLPQEHLVHVDVVGVQVLLHRGNLGGDCLLLLPSQGCPCTRQEFPGWGLLRIVARLIICVVHVASCCFCAVIFSHNRHL